MKSMSLHLRADGQHGGEPVGGVLGGQRHQVRVEAGLGEHLLADLHGDRERQHRTGVRLDDDRVAGDQRGEQAGPGVPGRERVAADHQRDARAARR